jgi:hypothetical protein
MWQAQEFMRRVGRTLRTQDDDFTHEQLPERWIDLIRYLDERNDNSQQLNNPKPGNNSVAHGKRTELAMLTL